ncbi:unnamed protein product [Ilex paraguariensis]|uniref:SKP1 component dimerisation domain-containing protein n=1 Tax=Ilex paraguariensis TaxID=185542 RepID=A0ABC8SAT3_9AQUA
MELLWGLVYWCLFHSYGFHVAHKVVGDILFVFRMAANYLNIKSLLDLTCQTAANYLNIKSLLDLTCQTVADMFKGKTPEEIRKTFNIENDFTPEEEEEVRRENAWTFE